MLSSSTSLLQYSISLSNSIHKIMRICFMNVTHLKHVSSLRGCIDQLSWSTWWREARWCFLDQRDGVTMEWHDNGRESCHQGWTAQKIFYSHWSASWKTAEQIQTIIQSCPLTAHGTHGTLITWERGEIGGVEPLPVGYPEVKYIKIQ